MNILFAGPWDLVGKTTAEHFLREGHDVCWLTEEPKRTLWDKKLHGTICRGQYKTAQIVPILRSHRIDAVIVLTAGLREGPDAAADVRTEPLGELLTALREYPVRCFAYLSSVELDYVLDYRKAQPGSSGLLRTALVHPVEALEYSVQVFVWDAYSRVRNNYLCEAIFISYRHINLSKRPVVLDGVVHKVVYELVYVAFIGIYQHLVCLQTKRYVLLFGPVLKQLYYVFGLTLEVDYGKLSRVSDFLYL